MEYASLETVIDSFFTQYNINDLIKNAHEFNNKIHVIHNHSFSNADKYVSIKNKYIGYPNTKSVLLISFKYRFRYREWHFGVNHIPETIKQLEYKMRYESGTIYFYDLQGDDIFAIRIYK